MANQAGIDIPRNWLRLDVFLASFGVNLLAMAMPIVVLQSYDRIIPNQALDTFTILVIGIGGVILLEILLKVLRSTILAWSGARFEHSANMNVFSKVLYADSLAYNQHSQGYYLSRMQSVEDLQRFFSGQSMLLLLDLPFAFLFLGLIWFIGGELVLVPALLMVLFAVVAVVLGKKLEQALEVSHQTEQHRQNFLIESLNNIHTIKSMAMESLMMRRYERLQERSAEGVYSLAHINSVVQGVGSTFSQVAMVLVVAFGALIVLEGELSVGALAAVTMLTGRALQPGLKAMGLWTQLQSVRIARKQAQELSDLPAEQSGDYRPDEPPRGDVVVEDVWFRYPETEEWLLKGISFDVPAGGAVAITGRNGVGKSTLLSLVAGLVKPEKGEIRIDDKPLPEYEAELLRHYVGFVPQHGTLYEGTILENMTLFRSGDVIEQALNLSRHLGLDEIVARLPDGLDTLVGGSAVDPLSEAVKQKILMVRSLVGDPRIMILDDANANFDLKNDAKLLNLLQRIRGSRTLIVVSYRPSFLRICDKAYELRDGELIQLQRRREVQIRQEAPR
ncbi:ATP-binding cassette domain-containing protein [Pontibacterium sp. N1Y112]|uniref:ATP-binding cassette domain-containing protein n=1 Tax=Pontibacterium sinense TaxID=2781979 RepID=A0A8J7K6M3_9GAMM|nr:ABC transporter transmembrane domain-containing protein [Pontibacterium sinense]MBE9398690.1 ATP-binding cassette domain-containing protein [Pontibacterium sinense]